MLFKGEGPVVICLDRMTSHLIPYTQVHAAADELGEDWSDTQERARELVWNRAGAIQRGEALPPLADAWDRMIEEAKAGKERRPARRRRAPGGQGKGPAPVAPMLDEAAPISGEGHAAPVAPEETAPPEPAEAKPVQSSTEPAAGTGLVRGRTAGRQPELNITAPDLDRVPQLFAADAYTDDAGMQQDVDRLKTAYERWNRQPLVRAYLNQDHDARPDGSGTPDNPIAQLDLAYTWAMEGLDGPVPGGADETVRRIYAVAAWCQALEPAVDPGLLTPLQDMYTAAHLLTAQAQATVAAFAAEQTAAEETFTPEPDAASTSTSSPAGAVGSGDTAGTEEPAVATAGTAPEDPPAEPSPPAHDPSTQPGTGTPARTPEQAGEIEEHFGGEEAMHALIAQATVEAGWQRDVVWMEGRVAGYLTDVRGGEFEGARAYGISPGKTAFANRMLSRDAAIAHVVQRARQEGPPPDDAPNAMMQEHARAHLHLPVLPEKLLPSGPSHRAWHAADTAITALTAGGTSTGSVSADLRTVRDSAALLRNLTEPIDRKSLGREPTKIEWGSSTSSKFQNLAQWADAALQAMRPEDRGDPAWDQRPRDFWNHPANSAAAAAQEPEELTLFATDEQTPRPPAPDTDSSPQFTEQPSEEIDPGDLKVGDFVEVRGQLITSGVVTTRQGYVLAAPEKHTSNRVNPQGQGTVKVPVWRISIGDTPDADPTIRRNLISVERDRTVRRATTSTEAPANSLDAAVQSLIRVAGSIGRVSDLAAADDVDTFTLGFADWAQRWMLDQWSDKPTRWPAWVDTYFSTEPASVRPLLLDPAAATLYGQLRSSKDAKRQAAARKALTTGLRRDDPIYYDMHSYSVRELFPEEGTVEVHGDGRFPLVDIVRQKDLPPMSERHLANGWRRYTSLGRTYTAARLPADLASRSPATLGWVIVADDTGEMIGRQRELIRKDTVRWMIAHPGVPDDMIVKFLDGSGLPPYTEAERAYVDAGPSAAAAEAEQQSGVDVPIPWKDHLLPVELEGHRGVLRRTGTDTTPERSGKPSPGAEAPGWAVECQCPDDHSGVVARPDGTLPSTAADAYRLMLWHVAGEQGPAPENPWPHDDTADYTTPVELGEIPGRQWDTTRYLGYQFRTGQGLYVTRLGGRLRYALRAAEMVHLINEDWAGSRETADACLLLHQQVQYAEYPDMLRPYIGSPEWFGSPEGLAGAEQLRRRVLERQQAPELRGEELLARARQAAQATPVPPAEAETPPLPRRAPAEAAAGPKSLSDPDPAAREAAGNVVRDAQQHQQQANPRQPDQDAAPANAGGGPLIPAEPDAAPTEAITPASGRKHSVPPDEPPSAAADTTAASGPETAAPRTGTPTPQTGPAEATAEAAPQGLRDPAVRETAAQALRTGAESSSRIPGLAASSSPDDFTLGITDWAEQWMLDTWSADPDNWPAWVDAYFSTDPATVRDLLFTPVAADLYTQLRPPVPDAPAPVEAAAEGSAPDSGHGSEGAVPHRGPAPETYVRVARQAAEQAADADNKALAAVIRSRARNTDLLEDRMHKAHTAALDAEKYAGWAQRWQADGVNVPTLANFARSAVDAAVRAQEAAGVPVTADILRTELEVPLTAEERAEQDSARRRRQARQEAEARAATGMDADNRDYAAKNRFYAEEHVPALGWTAGHVRVLEAAGSGRLYVGGDGQPRQAPRPGVWDAGRKVSRTRTQALLAAQFLVATRQDDGTRVLTLSPTGETALALARLYPQGLYDNDKAAYEARYARVARRHKRMDDKKAAARRLPPLDPTALRLYQRPVTLDEQEARAQQEAAGSRDDGGGYPSGAITPGTAAHAEPAPGAGPGTRRNPNPEEPGRMPGEAADSTGMPAGGLPDGQQRQAGRGASPDRPGHARNAAAVPAGEPAEARPFTETAPLAADAGYHLHLTGTGGQGSPAGELRHADTDTTIATLHRSVSGTWFARLVVDGRPADVTYSTGSPQDAAHQGAVLFSAVTGTPFGVPPGATAADGPLTRADVLRAEVRDAAQQHLDTITTAAARLSADYARNPQFQELGALLRDMAAAVTGAHSSQQMTAQLAAVQQAAGSWGSALPGGTGGERRHLVFPLAHLVYDTVRLQGRLQATLDAVQAERADAREPVAMAPTGPLSGGSTRPAPPDPEPVLGPVTALGLRIGSWGQLVASVGEGDSSTAYVPGVTAADLPGMALPATAEVPVLRRTADRKEQLVSDEETRTWLDEHLPHGPLAPVWDSPAVRGPFTDVVRDLIRDGMAPTVDEVAAWLVDTAAEHGGLLQAARTAGLDDFRQQFARAADDLVTDSGSEHLLWTYLKDDGARRARVLALAAPRAYEQLRRTETRETARTARAAGETTGAAADGRPQRPQETGTAQAGTVTAPDRPDAPAGAHDSGPVPGTAADPNAGAPAAPPAHHPGEPTAASTPKDNQQMNDNERAQAATREDTELRPADGNRPRNPDAEHGTIVLTLPAPGTYEQPQPTESQEAARTTGHAEETTADSEQWQNEQDRAQAATHEGIELRFTSGNRLRDLDIDAGHGTIVNRGGAVTGWVRARTDDDGRRRWWVQAAAGGPPKGFFPEGQPPSAGVPAIRVAGWLQDTEAPSSRDGSPIPADAVAGEIRLTAAQVRELRELTPVLPDGSVVDMSEWRDSQRLYAMTVGQMRALADAAWTAATAPGTATAENRRRQGALTGAVERLDAAQYHAARRGASVPPLDQPDPYAGPYRPQDRTRPTGPQAGPAEPEQSGPNTREAPAPTAAAGPAEQTTAPARPHAEPGPEATEKAPAAPGEQAVAATQDTGPAEPPATPADPAPDADPSRPEPFPADTEPATPPEEAGVPAAGDPASTGPAVSAQPSDTAAAPAAPTPEAPAMSETAIAVPSPAAPPEREEELPLWVDTATPAAADTSATPGERPTRVRDALMPLSDAWNEFIPPHLGTAAEALLPAIDRSMRILDDPRWEEVAPRTPAGPAAGSDKVPGPDAADDVTTTLAPAEESVPGPAQSPTAQALLNLGNAVPLARVNQEAAGEVPGMGAALQRATATQDRVSAAATRPDADKEPGVVSGGARSGADTVNQALRQADRHTETLRNLPEWQQIQTIRGAVRHLWNVIKEKAGPHWGKLIGDGRVQDFFRTVTAKTLTGIGRLAQAGAERLQNNARDRTGRDALPAAQALLDLGDAAFTHNNRNRRGGTPTAEPPAQGDRKAPAEVPGMGAALQRATAKQGRVSAAAAKSRSNGGGNQARKPAPATGAAAAAQPAHLRNPAEQPAAPAPGR